MPEHDPGEERISGDWKSWIILISIFAAYLALIAVTAFILK